METEGMCHVGISYGEDIREKVFYLFAEERLPIYGMKQMGETLEEVFLQLTQNAGGEKE